MKNFDLARKICKEHGVKGFRKLALKRPIYVAGKQTAWLNSCIAERLIARLIEEGFEIGGLEVCRQLAAKGHLDCLSIS